MNAVFDEGNHELQTAGIRSVYAALCFISYTDIKTQFGPRKPPDLLKLAKSFTHVQRIPFPQNYRFVHLNVREMNTLKLSQPTTKCKTGLVMSGLATRKSEVRSLSGTTTFDGMKIIKNWKHLENYRMTATL